MDPSGGTAFQVLSTSQLLSVPYALHANTVQTGDNWGTDIVNTDATLTGNGTVATPLKIASNGVNSSKILDGSIASSDLANGAVTTAKLSNLAVTSDKIQNEAVTTDKLVNNAVTTDKINSGAVTGAKISQAGATTGQVLKWNGTTWSPALDETDGGLILPYSGTGTSGSPIFNIENLGTSGAISTLSSGNYGIWGESTAIMGIGVYGVNKTSSGKTFGVFGDVYSASGYSGYFQGGKVFIQGNTGIGIQDPSAKLEVAGQVKITGGTPGTGKVLTSDADGLSTWQTPTLINHNHIGEIWNASVGWSAGAFKVTNTLNGPSIWGVNSGGGNAIRGDGYNNSIGVYGEGNSGAGLKGHSLSGNGVEGSTSTATAYSGFFTGGRFYVEGNTGIGTQTPGAKLEVAGQVKITGGTPGAGKVLTSDAAGLASWQTPASNPWLKNGSDIYYNNGNVAIGMTFPRYNLTIYNDNNPLIGFYNSTSGTTGSDGFTIGTYSSGSPVWIWNWENSNMHFATNNTNRMIINADGHVSMMSYLDLNTDGTFAALKVGGKQALWSNGTYFSWGYDATYNYFADRIMIGNPTDHSEYMLYITGNAFATGLWSGSDERFKKNISLIDNSLEKVMKVRGTSFEFRSDEFKDYQFAEGKQFGFIAQELENEFPELVKTESDGYKSVNYNGMIPVLLEAIKDQQKMINDLQNEIVNLKTNAEKIETENNLKPIGNAKIISRLKKIETILEYNAEK